MAGTSANFEVLLTEGTEQDLEAIHDYICEFNCVANANYVLDELMDVVESLSKFPVEKPTVLGCFFRPSHPVLARVLALLRRTTPRPG